MLISLSGVNPEVITKARHYCPEDSEIWLAELVRTVHIPSEEVSTELDQWVNQTVRFAVTNQVVTAAALTRAADRGVHGALVQVLDPAEEAFPYDGRTIFESVGGSLSHETQKAGDLRSRYLERLAARKAALRDLARNTGWQYHCHLTDHSAANALLWLFHATEHSV